MRNWVNIYLPAVMLLLYLNSYLSDYLLVTIYYPGSWMGEKELLWGLGMPLFTGRERPRDPGLASRRPWDTMWDVLRVFVVFLRTCVRPAPSST